MRTEGSTFIKAKKSRNHTETMSKYLNLTIKVNNKKNYDLIKVEKVKKIKPINYNIPSDISSGAFFMVLTAYLKLSTNYQKCKYQSIKNWSYYNSKKMGVKISFQKKKIIKVKKLQI